MPMPVVNLVNNADVFRLRPRVFSAALNEGVHYVDFDGSTKYEVTTQPADWAWALVANANADLPERLMQGAKLLARELSPLETDYALLSSIERAGGQFKVGAEVFKMEKDAIDYVKRWANHIRLSDMLPRDFDPDICREDSFTSGGGYVQHEADELNAFTAAYRDVLASHFGEREAGYFLSKKFGPRSERAQRARPLSILAMRLRGVDEKNREWSPGTWRGGKSRDTKIEREWPYIIKGGYLFINSKKVETAEQLHGIL